jgi:hypothetical protein
MSVNGKLREENKREGTGIYGKIRGYFWWYNLCNLNKEVIWQVVKMEINMKRA